MSSMVVVTVTMIAVAVTVVVHRFGLGVLELLTTQFIFPENFFKGSTSDYAKFKIRIFSLYA